MTRAGQVLALIEEFETAMKAGGRYVEIFKNPTTSDILTIKKTGSTVVRFLLDRKKKAVHVWDGYGALHDRVEKDLGLKNAVHGVGVITPKGSIVVGDVDGGLKKEDEFIGKMGFNFKDAAKRQMARTQLRL
jgi:hypothetical protein